MKEHIASLDITMFNVAFLGSGLVLCICLGLAMLYRGMKFTRINKFYLGVLAWLIVFLVSSMTEQLYNKHTSSTDLMIIKVSLFIGYVAIANGLFCFLGYLISYIDEHIGKTSTMLYRFVAMCSLYLVGASIVSMWNGCLFDVTKDGVYIKGEYFGIIVTPCLLSFLCALLNFFVHIRKFTMLERVVFMVYMIIPISGIALQFCFPNLYMFAPDTVYIMLLIYLAFQTNLEKELKHSNEAKDIFLANMSHEIRTPINSVIGMNEMILRETKEATIKEYARSVKKSSYNLLTTINDILDISKIDSGQMVLVPVEYKLVDVLYEVHTQYHRKLTEKKIACNINIDEKMPLVLYGDEVRIRQIVMNLVSNAVKYTSEGSVSVNVSGVVKGDMVDVTFTVEDTGVGISPENIRRMFSRFERVDKEKNRNINGAGLGISIVVELLTMMGSELIVKSEVGKGSRFQFTISQKIINAEPIGALSYHMKSAKKEAAQRYVAPNASILVVDDNVFNCRVISNLLKRSEVAVTLLTSGSLCLEEIQKKTYDIIFLDHMMPEMDGVETLRNMQELQGNLCKDTPVIMLTANDAERAGEAYIKKGFNDYLAKPIRPNLLEKMLYKYLPEEKLEVVEAPAQEDDVPSVVEKKEKILALYPFFECSDAERDAKEVLVEFCQSMQENLSDLKEQMRKDTGASKEYSDCLKCIQTTASKVGTKDIVYWCGAMLNTVENVDRGSVLAMQAILEKLIRKSIREAET